MRSFFFTHSSFLLQVGDETEPDKCRTHLIFSFHHHFCFAIWRIFFVHKLLFDPESCVLSYGSNHISTVYMWVCGFSLFQTAVNVPVRFNTFQCSKLNIQFRAAENENFVVLMPPYSSKFTFFILSCCPFIFIEPRYNTVLYVYILLYNIIIRLCAKLFHWFREEKNVCRFN